MRSGTRNLITAVWALAILVGGYAAVLRLTSGHELAGNGSYVVWGLGVAQYTYFVGISAGAFLIASLGYGFGVKRLETVARPALVTAFAGLVAGLVSVWTDLGWMGRAFSVFFRPNFGSVMTWLIWFYTLYAAVLVAALIFAAKGDPRVRGAVTLGVPLALAISGGSGALFATLNSRPLWNTALYPILFMAGALLSAAGLLLVLLALQERRSQAAADASHLMSRVLLVLLGVYALMEWTEYSVALWYGGGDQAAVRQVLFGSYWWVFWLVHVVLGLVVPVTLLTLRPGNRGAQGWAGFLSVATYLAVRLNLVIPGLITPQLPGLESSYTDPRLVFSYTPTFFEWGLFLFAAALGVGLIWAGLRYVPHLPDVPRSLAHKEGKAA